MGKSTINGHGSIAMLNYQRVVILAVCECKIENETIGHLQSTNLGTKCLALLLGLCLEKVKSAEDISGVSGSGVMLWGGS